MYKTEKSVQMTFEGFNQSCGMKLNVRDEWVVVADSIDWAAIEEKYMAFFPSRRGRPAVNARMALAVLVANLFGAGLSFLSFISWTRQTAWRLSISWRCRTMPRRTPDARTCRAPWRRKACTLGKINPLMGRHYLLSVK